MPRCRRSRPAANFDHPACSTNRQLQWYIGSLGGLFRSRASREPEIAFLHQQMLVLTRSAPANTTPRPTDRLIFESIYRLFPAVRDAAVIFKPETLVAPASSWPSLTLGNDFRPCAECRLRREVLPVLRARDIAPSRSRSVISSCSITARRLPSDCRCPLPLGRRSRAAPNRSIALA